MLPEEEAEEGKGVADLALGHSKEGQGACRGRKPGDGSRVAGGLGCLSNEALVVLECG